MTGNLSLKFFSCPPPSKKQGKLVNIEDCCTQKDAWPALHAEILCYARLPLHKYSQSLGAGVSEERVSSWYSTLLYLVVSILKKDRKLMWAPLTIYLVQYISGRVNEGCSLVPT